MRIQRAIFRPRAGASAGSGAVRPESRRVDRIRGQIGTTHGFAQELVSLVGTTWHAAALTLPRDALVGQRPFLAGVTCGRVGGGAVIGQYENTLFAARRTSWVFAG